MAKHTVGTQEEWQAECDELLAQEKELTRRNDELARKRRELPWVPVEKEYSFETDEGEKTLAELFDGRSQLGLAPASSCGRLAPEDFATGRQDDLD
jgi:predicted dithiol-disulfide oxidoreductase (DUF899 family)